MLCPSIKGYDKVFKEAEIVHSWHAMLQCSVPWEVTALLGDCMSDFTETLLLSFLLAEMWYASCCFMVYADGTESLTMAL